MFPLRAGEFMVQLRERAVKSGGLVVSADPVLFPEPEAGETEK